MKLSTVFQSMFNQGMDTSLLQNLTSNTLPEMKAARLWKNRKVLHIRYIDDMGVSKNMGKPPKSSQIIHFHRVFHEINHPFWGVFPLFLVQHQLAHLGSHLEPLGVGVFNRKTFPVKTNWTWKKSRKMVGWVRLLDIHAKHGLFSGYQDISWKFMVAKMKFPLLKLSLFKKHLQNFGRGEPLHYYINS